MASQQADLLEASERPVECAVGRKALAIRNITDVRCQAIAMELAHVSMPKVDGGRQDRYFEREPTRRTCASRWDYKQIYAHNVNGRDGRDELAVSGVVVSQNGNADAPARRRAVRGAQAA